MTGPAMMNIFAPTPETSPSLRNSMAGATTALAKPVMGTSVPAPAVAASFWYQPIAVVKADRPMSVALVSVPASVSVKPRAAYSMRRPSPKRQMAPPTKNAHRQSFKSGEGGDAALRISSYFFASSFIFLSLLLRNIFAAAVFIPSPKPCWMRSGPGRHRILRQW